jgi:hypothetical protein
MKKLKYLAATSIVVAVLASQASANLISEFEGGLSLVNANPETTLAWLQGYTGNSNLEICDNLPRINFDPAVNSYTASWNLTGTGEQLAFVLAKDGAVLNSGQPPQLLYRLYSVPAGQSIVGSGTVSFTSGKAVSHVDFFCLPGTASVPDGGTTGMLLAMALGGIGVAKRFLSA